MARRAFLHIGTAKSGTTYLQELWWRHRTVLRERGLLLPGEALRDHFHAPAMVKGMTQVVDELDADAREAWHRLLTETRDWPGDVLISHEHFSDSPADAAAAAARDLAAVADELHLVVTVRDLGRVLPSAWQQRVKQGARQGLSDFLNAVRKERADQKFWRYQDVPAMVARWAVDVPDERVHLVVVPGPGAARDELWLRAGRVLGVDVSDLDADPRRPNESLALVETELLRRVNVATPRERRTLALQRLTKGTFARRVLAGSAPDEPLTLPATHTAWVHEHASRSLAELRGHAYDVVGDLDDLLPAAARTGRDPSDVSDAELLAAATTVVARMVEATRTQHGHR